MLLRIGAKIINLYKIHQILDNIMLMRSRGYSQLETSESFGLDRTVISKLETLGEIRRGGKVAIIGFPIKNCEEIDAVARQTGIDYCLVLSEQGRQDFIKQRSGLELFNDFVRILSQLRTYETVIVIGSDKRVALFGALLDKEIVAIKIGESPLVADEYVDPAKVRTIMEQLL